MLFLYSHNKTSAFLRSQKSTYNTARAFSILVTSQQTMDNNNITMVIRDHNNGSRITDQATVTSDGFVFDGDRVYFGGDNSTETCVSLFYGRENINITKSHSTLSCRLLTCIPRVSLYGIRIIVHQINTCKNLYHKMLD